MDPNLMRTPCFEMHLDKRRPRPRFECFVMGHALPSTSNHGPLVILGWMSVDGGIDRPHQRIKKTMHDRVVLLVHHPFLELSLERGVRRRALGYNHRPRRPNIEPVHHALTLRCSGRRQSMPGGGQGIGHRRPRPTRARMSSNTCRLVDHDNVVVLPQNRNLHRGCIGRRSREPPGL